MEITYFPYLPLRENETIDLGDGLVIWHYYSLSTQYISDESTRNFITKLIEANVEGEAQEKIKGVAVASIGNTDFRQFSPSEEIRIQEAKLMLFLSKIVKTNTTILGSGADGWTLSTSENFQPVFQRFQIGNEHISEAAGYIINVGIGGYTVDEKKFLKPSHVSISPYGLSLDRELLNQLLKLRRRNGKRLFRRIMRATELLFQAYFNTSNVSINARILLIAAAFETLLDLKDPPRKDFKEYIEKYCDIPGEVKYRHYYKQRNGRKKRDKDRSIKVLWADSFFSLRNQIIHGDYVPEDMYIFKSSNRHVDISILFFSILVKRLINDKTGEPKPFADYIEWKHRNDGTEGFHYEDMSVALSIARGVRRVFGSRRNTT